MCFKQDCMYSILKNVCVLSLCTSTKIEITDFKETIKFSVSSQMFLLSIVVQDFDVPVFKV